MLKCHYRYKTILAPSYIFTIMCVCISSDIAVVDATNNVVAVIADDQKSRLSLQGTYDIVKFLGCHAMRSTDC